MVLFWPILAPKYEVPKLNTPKYVTLQKLTAKIEHCLNIFLYLYSLVCTFLSYFFTVVKELRSKMFGQHPGYFKAVFLKKTQIIIVSIYEYTVYIMF